MALQLPSSCCGNEHHNNGSHITIAKLLKLNEKLTMAEQLPSPNFKI
jgi:hypothetical protein